MGFALRTLRFRLGSFSPAWLVLLTYSHLPAAPNNSLLDISADGKLLACANRDSGTVTIIDRLTLGKLWEVPVGAHPEGISFVGRSHELAVTVYDEDKIVWLDADSGSTIGQLAVFDEPYSIVSDWAGQRLYVTLDYPGQVVEIDARERIITRAFDTGPFSRGLALAADEKRLFVSQFYTADVVALDLTTGEVVDRWPGISNDNLARQLVPHPHRPKLYLPHIRSRVTAVHGEGSIFPYISAIDTQSNEVKRRRRIPMDSFLGIQVTANPWEAAISPDGKSFYVVFAGTDDMFACQVIDDDYREISYRQRATLGSNPRAIRVSPDGATVYVYNALDFQIVALDAITLKSRGMIDVSENPLRAEVLRGKTLFYSALPPMVGRRWISCASCHPDGQPDGRTWHNPEGLRNTQSLAGLDSTHPIHWSADRDEVQDFEFTIRGPLMQGRGLVSGAIHNELEAPNKGISVDLDALAAYTNSHPFTLSPFAKQGLNDSAHRGRAIFFSGQTRCTTCHNGSQFTDSRTGNRIVRHDVGTGSDDAREKMGPAYDTPTLLGIYRTAPYLHDGRAATIIDVLTKYNPRDQHGTTSHLTAEQVVDLVEFLKSLPFEGGHSAVKGPPEREPSH